ncbi:MAG: cytochrome PufQ [Paracoccaceae bacterium]
MKQSTVKDFRVSDYRRTIKIEYRIYFALIFLISIPLATFAWIGCLIMNMFNSDSVQNEGIFKRAWGHAQVITPMIFTA